MAVVVCSGLCVVAVAIAIAAVAGYVNVVVAVVVELVTSALVAAAAAVVVEEADYEQNVAAMSCDGLWTSVFVGPSAIERRRTSRNKK